MTDGYVFFSAKIAERLPPLYSQEGKGDDAIVYVKFFTPDSSWTWYATEYDPHQRLFFGFVVGWEAELGYFSLDELQNATGPFGMPVERDIGWKPETLREVMSRYSHVNDHFARKGAFNGPDD